MIFSSYKFLLYLLIVFSGYTALNKIKSNKLAKVWLVLASFYFYAQGSKDFLPFFLASVLFNYLIGFSLHKSTAPWLRKVILFLCIIENVALLGYFKYTDFFITNYNLIATEIIPLKHIVLPIGISFFTFQLIAYGVDCYRNESQEYSFINYLLFITFFPQLIVGPIVHHKDIVPQFESPNQAKLNFENISLGIFIFILGCSKKVLIADPLTEFAKPFFMNVDSVGFLEAWTSSLSFTFSYYFDLSGYADMAIGLGLLFNIQLPQNFNSPYKSRNFREYWRRWHMSLSRFLSDYVFRTIYKKDDSSFKFYFAVMMTFLVSGFWHGAGWRFVIWGIINGVFVCFAHYMARHKLSLPIYVAWTLTFLGVVLTRIIFVSPRLMYAVTMMKKLLDLSQFSGLTLFSVTKIFTDFAIYNAYVLFILAIAAFLVFGFKNTKEITTNFDFTVKKAFFAGILLALSLVQMTIVSDFLYFQF